MRVSTVQLTITPMNTGGDRSFCGRGSGAGALGGETLGAGSGSGRGAEYG